MWMFTKDGFFSAVKNRYCTDNEIAVRARSMTDITRFCKATKTPENKVLTTTDADYRFRVHVPHSVWVDYAAAAADGIDYPNFKSATCPGDPDRAHAYHGCWESMYRWQQQIS